MGRTLPTFETVADAERAGYRRPREADGDTLHVASPPGDAGQAPVPQGWTSADGRRSRAVRISSLRNNLGERGAWVDMIPPATREAPAMTDRRDAERESAWRRYFDHRAEYLRRALGDEGVAWLRLAFEAGWAAADDVRDAEGRHET